MPLVKHNQSCVILKIVRLKSNASNDLTIIIFFVSIKNVFINGVMFIYVCAEYAAKMQWYICDWQVNAYGYSYTSCCSCMIGANSHDSVQSWRHFEACLYRYM
jgi:hypothetical protein